MILVGSISSIGHLGVFSSNEDGSPVLVTEKEYVCKDYPSLAAILEDFLDKHQLQEPLYAACFGISGPVKSGLGKILSLKWEFTEGGLSELLTKVAWNCQNAGDLHQSNKGMPVEVINSLGSIDPSNLEAKSEELVDLNLPSSNSSDMGESRHNCAAITVGRGIGEVLFYWDSFNNGFRASPSEGGHANFAPRTQMEIDLLSYLLKRFTPVSYDQILSQRGLVNIYQFLKDTGRGKETAKEVTADAIIKEALANPTDKNNLCTQALDLFVSILGAEAGNLALKYYALGGVYISGVMVPGIVGKLRDGSFMAAFTDRENKAFADLLATIPVKVVMNPKILLFGAAQRALDKERMGKTLYAQCQK